MKSSTPVAQTLGAILLLVAILAVPTTALAAVVVVDTTTDETAPDGNCSLRQAMLAVALDVDVDGCIGTGAYGSDTITFDPALFDLPFGFGAFNLTLGTLGQLGGSVHIMAPAGKTALLLGNDSFPIITLDQAPNASFELSGVRLINGASASNGGGIRVLGGTSQLTLQDVRIESSTAALDGGAIGLESEDPIRVTLVDSVLLNNEAGRNGGAIGGDVSTAETTGVSNLWIESSGSRFTGNEAGDSGGAIAVLLGAGLPINDELGVRIDLVDSTLTSNEAQGKGGALYVNKTSQAGFVDLDVTLAATIFEGNSAGGDGGAAVLWQQSGSAGSTRNTLVATIDDSRFEGNQADGSGGAISVLGQFDELQGPVVVQRSTFIANSAGLGGGAVSYSHIVGHVLNSQFIENEAGQFGGGLLIFNRADTVFDREQHVRGNTFYGNVGGLTDSRAAGWNLHAEGGDFNLDNIIRFVGNGFQVSPTSPIAAGDSDCLITALTFAERAYNFGNHFSCVSGATDSSSVLSEGPIAHEDVIHHTIVPPRAGGSAIDGWPDVACTDETGAPLQQDLLGDRRIGGVPIDGDGVPPADCDVGAIEAPEPVPVSSFNVGGTVTGLAGSGLILRNNGGDDLAIGADGAFEFATPVDDGQSYAVTVAQQPSSPSQTCTVGNGSGTISGAEVTNVTVTCQTGAFAVRGTVAGLTGSGLVLRNNGGDDLPIAGDGAFQFATPVLDGQPYAVTVAQQPGSPDQTCTVASGSGTVDGADITNVQVSCENATFPVGGTVSGLAGAGLVLRNNGGDDLPIGGDGAFEFATPVADGQAYAVSVAQQPATPNQFCTVTNGNGTINGAAIVDVLVVCENTAYFVGGTVAGLVGSGLVLSNNGRDELEISGDGDFQFPTPIADGEAYAVTIAQQPGSPSQTCTVSNGSGTIDGADVGDVAVICDSGGFSVGGDVTGLEGTGLVLQNNRGDDLPIADNGPFTFATLLADRSTYSVSVFSQPTEPAQDCFVDSGTGTIEGASVDNVIIECVTRTFSIGGTVEGLEGTGLTLRNNGGAALLIGSNGAFTFPTPVADGESFQVTVSEQPRSPDQSCTVTGGKGTVSGADVTSVLVRCQTGAFTVGGSVSGLLGAGLVLQNNGTENLRIFGDGTFVFPTALADQSTYHVTVLSQPTDPAQTCVVSNDSGTINGAAIDDIGVACTTETFTVGGTVVGLEGTGLVLRNNGVDPIEIGTDGPFQFPTPLADGQPFEVTIAQQPASPEQTCTVARGSGELQGADVTDVAVACGGPNEADLAITKTDEQDVMAPGDPITYFIKVSNAGPAAVAGAQVIDLLPPELADVTWICTPGDGASCAAGGADELDTLVDLAPGSSVLFALSASTPLGPASITNRAQVVAPLATPDFNPENDEAEDRTATDLIFTDSLEDADARLLWQLSRLLP